VQPGQKYMIFPLIENPESGKTLPGVPDLLANIILRKSTGL
jgi:hypothetical protein